MDAVSGAFVKGFMFMVTCAGWCVGFWFALIVVILLIKYFKWTWDRLLCGLEYVANKFMGVG